MVLPIAISALIFVLSEQVLYAQPTSPPPTGKVWVKSGSVWTLVPTPPLNAPYVWIEDHWERITTYSPKKGMGTAPLG